MVIPSSLLFDIEHSESRWVANIKTQVFSSRFIYFLLPEKPSRKYSNADTIKRGRGKNYERLPLGKHFIMTIAIVYIHTCRHIHTGMHAHATTHTHTIIQKYSQTHKCTFFRSSLPEFTWLRCDLTGRVCRSWFTKE